MLIGAIIDKNNEDADLFQLSWKLNLKLAKLPWTEGGAAQENQEDARQVFTSRILNGRSFNVFYEDEKKVYGVVDDPDWMADDDDKD